jgi:hypothetical protein
LSPPLLPPLSQLTSTRWNSNTAPGGWCEFQDFDAWWYSEDDSLTESSALVQFVTHLNTASRKIGLEPRLAPKLPDLVKDAGFENVYHEVFKFPVGTWPKDKRLKEIGAYNHMQVVDGLEAFAMAAFTRVLEWPRERIEGLLRECREDLKNRDIHPIYDVHVVYGQKPVLE